MHACRSTLEDPTLAVTILAHAAALPGWRALLVTTALTMRRAPRRALVVALLVVFAAAGGFVIALFPPTAFDETTYHLPFARAFLGGAMPWVPELRVATFPLLGEALQAALLLGWGERGPHHLALFATLLTAALLLVWGREADRRETGWLAAALFLGSPLVTYLAGTGYVDPLVGLFVTAAFYTLWRASTSNGDEDWYLVAGFLAGAAAAVKYLGLYAVLVGALALLARRHPRWHMFSPFAFGAAAAMVIPYGNLLWRTGNPLFPYFPGLFGASPWQTGVPAALRHHVVLLPFDAVFRRQLVGDQPPLSPALLLGIVFVVVAMMNVPRLRLGALVVAGFLPAFAVMAVVSRYLVTVLPLWCLLVALGLSWCWLRLRGAAPSPLASGLLALGLALPGVAYGGFYLAQRRAIPDTPQERVAYLAETHPGYRALRWLDQRERGRYVARCLACEQLHGFARGRLLGEVVGPWGYQPVMNELDDPPALQREVSRDGARFLLLPRTTAGALRTPAARGRFTRVYADTEFEIWRVTP